jgi:hypothetical protein
MLVSLFVAIFDAPGTSDQIPGSIMLITFTKPMNIINKIIAMNPILDKRIPLLSLSLKYFKQAKENIITMITAIVTNIERLGNSVGEKDDIVSNIRRPPIIVASIISRSFGFIFIFIQIIFNYNTFISLFIARFRTILHKYFFN